ncbi:MAG TPA: thrombospondin type 3 repeat-containing protein [Candidatus Hydrogenedens sp.]|nr:thrombospondin type 3 repeat-containing protein [Candidatus Hydrogenedens sp.]
MTLLSTKKYAYCLFIITAFNTFFCIYSFGEDDSWADVVVEYFGKNQSIGFTNPSEVLGAPLGFSASLPAMRGVYSIGTPGSPQESYIIVKFNTPVRDDPGNPMGLDCLVYSNAFWVGGDMKRKFVEPGLIEISKDVNGNGLPDDNWYVIPGSRNLNRAVFPQGLTSNNPPFAGIITTSTNEEVLWGYADVNPTMPPYRDNYLRPDNPFTVGIDFGTGGGDAFDIAWAVDMYGNVANIDMFDFLRISTIPNILDPAYGYYSTEIMAVADVAPNIDTDNDGILDEYETRIAGTDPNRPESSVLPLEIPIEWGGSPAGTMLGTACNHDETLCVSLYSIGNRTGERAYNCNVDLQLVSDPSPSAEVVGLLKGGEFIQFVSSIGDFQSAQIAPAELKVHYSAQQIEGMDETSLNIYRWDGEQWTNDGIEVRERDLSVNKITFRTRYPEIFGIFSVAGSGDINPGQGSIRLVANPTETKVYGYSEIVNIIGDEIRDVDNMPVPDGTLFTINSFLLNPLTTDEDLNIPGIQVSVKNSKLELELEPMTVAGKGRVNIQSLDNTIRGEVSVEILPGPPGTTVNLQKIEGGQYYGFMSDELFDIYGNPVRTGVVSIEIEGGLITTPDVLPDIPGHQSYIYNGRIFIIVKPITVNNLAQLELCIYDDEFSSNLLNCSYFEFEVKKLPITIYSKIALSLIFICLFLLINRYRKSGKLNDC